MVLLLPMFHSNPFGTFDFWMVCAFVSASLAGVLWRVLKHEWKPPKPPAEPHRRGRSVTYERIHIEEID